ncbi:PsbP-related protein [Deinococcus sp.]|uniref:PsbP-related protein n=1 Tax=Deinococcus sp. TaxID=47478 RepID=UPI0025B7B2B9|nr:PsbP-related protein [Deinococcus sp.]
MKRALLTLALLAAPALTGAAAQTAPAAAPTTAEQRTIEAITARSDRGFSLRVPAGWTPLKNVPDTDVAFAFKTVGALRPTVTVRTQDVEPSIKATLADFRDLFAGQLVKEVPKLKMLGEKTIRVSGTPAILWTYTGDGEGGGVRWSQVFTVKNNRLYTVTLMIPNGAPAELIESGREILNSFALTGK